MSSMRKPGSAGHLPKQGGDTSPGPPEGLPRQRRGVTPQLHGRYPDYDVLSTTEHWDSVTRHTVLARVGQLPELEFFDDGEARALFAFCDVVTGQGTEPRIPVLQLIDAKLKSGKLDGFRYHDMPSDEQTWRRVAANLDTSARQEGCEAGFAGADVELQHRIVERFSEGELDWDLPVKRAWTVVMRMVLAAFYSHPWAWNEIGFGGPAYPRGYARLAPGQREHWESPPQFDVDPVDDVRKRELE